MSGDEALARRAVACAAWRWMPGMRVGSESIPGDGVTYGRVLHANQRGIQDIAAELTSFRRTFSTEQANAKLLPDLDDPATLGCMLALVREAWGQGDLCAQRWTDDGPKAWCVEFTGRDDYEGPPGQQYAAAWYGPSEAAALVAALEAAPTREVT